MVENLIFKVKNMKTATMPEFAKDDEFMTLRAIIRRSIMRQLKNRIDRDAVTVAKLLERGRLHLWFDKEADPTDTKRACYFVSEHKGANNKPAILLFDERTQVRKDD